MKFTRCKTARKYYENLDEAFTAANKTYYTQRLIGVQDVILSSPEKGCTFLDDKCQCVN